MKYILTIIPALLLSFTAKPCGNEYGYALDGTLMYTQYFFLSPRMLHFDSAGIERKLIELNQKVLNGHADYKVWSDIAINLMKTGHTDSAVKLLKPLYQKHPTEYNIIANLGTGYELLGKLDSALKYISKGYDLNPRSHRGSEWIHIKILKAKIKEKYNTGWLRKNEIVDLEELILGLDTTRLKSEVRRINHEFFYQIRTRAPFTPAPNKTLTNLFVTLGDFNQRLGTYENALLAYSYALKFQDHWVLERNIKEKIKELNKDRDQQHKIHELPDVFIRMIQRSRLNPEMLLMGLDDYAQQLDSIHLSHIEKQDSIKWIRNQLDSVTLLLKQQTENEINNVQKHTRKLYLLWIGILLGAGLCLMVLKFMGKRK